MGDARNHSLESREIRVGKRREIFQKALGDSDPDVRAAASRAIAILEAESDLKTLGNQLTSEVIEERLNAVHGLAALAKGIGSSQLVEALRDPEEAVRVAAAKSLGSICDLRTMEPLAAALEDKSHNVRRAVIEALGFFANRRLAPLLLVVLEEERDPEVLAAILRALGSTREVSAEEKVRDYCTHSDPQVRAAALESLGDFD